MRAYTLVCTNIDEIDKIRDDNETLNLPSPIPIPEPKYEEAVGWFHQDDITRANTKTVDGKSVATLIFSDGSYVMVTMTSEIEKMLDSVFRNTL